METVSDFRNDLLKRKEVKILIKSDSNPGFVEGGKKIGEQFSAAEDVIVVRNVKSKFGRNTFLIDAFIYDSAGDKDKVEGVKEVKGDAKDFEGGETASQDSAPPAQPQADQKKDEVKEEDKEVKVEEKKEENQEAKE